MRGYMKQCYVYFIRGGDKKHSPLKIGITESLSKRLKQMQTGSPKKLRLQFAIIFDNKKIAMNVEKILHEMLDGKRIHGEWFSCGVKTKVILNKLEPYFTAYHGEHGRFPIIYKV